MSRTIARLQKLEKEVAAGREEATVWSLPIQVMGPDGEIVARIEPYPVDTRHIDYRNGLEALHG